MNYYVLMERDYAYNDEYHSPNDGGIPKRVFQLCIDADKECLELNFKWLCSEGTFGSYGYHGEKGNFIRNLQDEGLITAEQAELLDDWNTPALDESLLAARKEEFVDICKRHDLWCYEVIKVQGD